MNNYDLTKFTNVNENEILGKKLFENSDGNYKSSVIANVDGVIYADDPRIDGTVDKSKKLVDVKKLMEINKKVADSGDYSLYEKAQRQVYSDEMLSIIEEAAKQKAKIDANPGLSPARILAAAGNTIETAYETVRRINYLTDVVGPQYVLDDYNADNAVNVRTVQDLQFKGFVKSSSLLQGQERIGDHVTPNVARQAFTAFDVSLLANSFRWEFGMREKKDSVFSLDAEIKKEVPGIMKRMKDDRITTNLNNLSGSDISPDWDAVSGNFYTGDAAGDIEGLEETLDTYRSPLVMMAARDTLRLYLKNQKAALTAEPSKSNVLPASGRTGILPKNGAVRYYINPSITDSSFILVAKNSWTDWFQGPTINVSYKNQMTPNSVEGRIIFEFNGDVEKITAAALRRTGVT